MEASDIYGAVVGAILGASSALLVAYLGWRRSSKEQIKKNMAEYRKNQMDQFYGPMLGLMKYSQEIFDLAEQKLPTYEDEHKMLHIDFNKFGTSQSGVQHNAIWNFFQVEYFNRVNSEMATLINLKRYFVESSELDALLDKFLEHEAQGKCLHNLWITLNESSDNVRNDGYPQALNGTLLAEYQKIKIDYRLLSGF